MIDVAEKERTSRLAIARAELKCSPHALKLLNEGRLEKGDALAAARIAGVMAAKHTPDFLPLCHPIAIHGVDVEVACDEKELLVRIEARVHSIERTGVEMEALTACAAAALTVYDMVKRHDRGMELVSLRLVHKSGGRTGDYTRAGEDLGMFTPPGVPKQPQQAAPDLTPSRGTKKLPR